MYILCAQGMRDTTGMDIREIRRENLRALLSEVRTKEELAEKIGTSPSYISQILGPREARDVGAHLARAAERAFHKPDGWMDTRHDIAPESPILSDMDIMFEIVTIVTKKLPHKPIDERRILAEKIFKYIKLADQPANSRAISTLAETFGE